MPSSADNTTVRIKLDKIHDDMEYQRLESKGRFNEVYGQQQKPIMRVENYGFSTSPPIGSIGMLTSLNGNSDQPIAHYLEHPKYRPKNKSEKDVWMYSAHNMQEGGTHEDYVKMEADQLTIAHKKKIILKVGSSTITITANNITIQSPRVDINP